MSTVVRNKGTLIPVSIDIEHFTDEDFDTLYENGMVVIDGQVYEVEWEVKAERDCDFFVEVNEWVQDGTIDFHTLHYDGGAHWTELVEDSLNSKEKLFAE